MISMQSDMYSQQQIEIFTKSVLNYGIGKEDFLIETGSNSGFSITYKELNQIFIVIDVGLVIRVHYMQTTDIYTGGNNKDVFQFKKSFDSWILKLNDMVRQERIARMNQDL